mgnify:FL=1
MSPERNEAPLTVEECASLIQLVQTLEQEGLLPVTEGVDWQVLRAKLETASVPAWLDETQAPAGYRAVRASVDEKGPSCNGCAFYGCPTHECSSRPCVPRDRVDAQQVIFVAKDDR